LQPINLTLETQKYCEEYQKDVFEKGRENGQHLIESFQVKTNITYNSEFECIVRKQIFRGNLFVGFGVKLPVFKSVLSLSVTSNNKIRCQCPQPRMEGIRKGFLKQLLIEIEKMNGIAAEEVQLEWSDMVLDDKSVIALEIATPGPTDIFFSISNKPVVVDFGCSLDEDCLECIGYGIDDTTVNRNSYKPFNKGIRYDGTVFLSFRISKAGNNYYINTILNGFCGEAVEEQETV
jgi:hypothetical protein